jgi:hypothetical protein
MSDVVYVTGISYHYRLFIISLLRKYPGAYGARKQVSVRTRSFRNSCLVAHEQMCSKFVAMAENCRVYLCLQGI